MEVNLVVSLVKYGDKKYRDLTSKYDMSQS